MALSAQHRPAELQGARRSGNQGKAAIRLPLVVLNGGGTMLRYITTFVAVAIGALVMVAGAVAGKPDIVNSRRSSSSGCSSTTAAITSCC